MFHFIINSKNYVESSGDASKKLASAILRVSKESEISKAGIKFYFAAPAFSILALSREFPELQILAQHLDPSVTGSTTGFLAPEIAKMSGASGSLVNHSEHRISVEEIRKTVDALRSLHIMSVVCARDAEEVSKFASFAPDFIAIEPPDLIGSGRAVSKVKPELITESKAALVHALKTDQSTLLLCGAGIIDAFDVKRAAELGAEGILIASGVVKAKDWEAQIRSLADGYAKR